MVVVKGIASAGLGVTAKSEWSLDAVKNSGRGTNWD